MTNDAKLEKEVTRQFKIGMRNLTKFDLPKISKICTLGCFWPKHIMFELRKSRGVMLDGTQASKHDTRNLANFHQNTWKSQNWHLDGIFCLKLKMYNLKIYRGSMCHDNEEWCKNWRGIDVRLSWRIWRILTRALKNLKTLHFNGLLLTKVYVWAKKVQTSYISWH